MAEDLSWVPWGVAGFVGAVFAGLLAVAVFESLGRSEGLVAWRIRRSIRRGGR